MEDIASNSVLRPVSQHPFNGRVIEHRAAGVEETYDVGDSAPEPKPLFALAQRLLGPLALGDIFQEPANARDFPILILNGEGATAYPADRAVRPHHPELRVREHTVVLLLHALDRPVPIVGMDSLDQERSCSRGFARPPQSSSSRG